MVFDDGCVVAVAGGSAVCGAFGGSDGWGVGTGCHESSTDGDGAAGALVAVVAVVVDPGLAEHLAAVAALGLAVRDAGAGPSGGSQAVVALAGLAYTDPGRHGWRDAGDDRMGQWSTRPARPGAGTV